MHVCCVCFVCFVCACACVCVYLCIYVQYIHIHTYLCRHRGRFFNACSVCICMYVYTYVCMYIRVYTRRQTHTHPPPTHVPPLFLRQSSFIHTHTTFCVFLYICVCIYTYVPLSQPWPEQKPVPREPGAHSRKSVPNCALYITPPES